MLVETAGIVVIQVDESTLRETLLLRRADRAASPTRRVRR